MKIGIVCDELSFNEHGGSNYSIHRLATELTNRGHKVDVVTLNLIWENDPPERREYDVNELDISRDGTVDAVRNVYNRIGDLREYDALHIYYPRLHPVFGLWNKRHNNDIRMIGHLNSYSFCSNTERMDNGCWEDCSTLKKARHSDSTGKSLLGNLPVYLFDSIATPRLMNHLDGYTALSPPVKEVYAGYGVDESLIQIVPNMADPTFPETLTDGGKGTKTRILFAGRTDPTKGVDTLIAACKQLEGDYHVDIVGDDILDYGFGLAEIEDEIQKHGLSDCVSTHGWVDYQDLSEYYAQADVFVHPGKWPEPFGRTILEALQHDCAVVCSNTGAPPWVAGSACLTFPKGDSDILAYRLNSIIRDDTLLDALQDSCPKELDRFDPEIVTDEYETILTE